jgi:hypothetical protein
MVGEYGIGKDLEGSGCVSIEVLPLYLSAGTEETHEKP